MNTKKKIYFLAVCLLATAFCFSQSSIGDTVHQLQTIQVVSNRQATYSVGNKIEELDSTTLNQQHINTLADLLTARSLVSIKSYGPGALSSPSFRGSGANHTAVLWNGFNISSSMNGQLDFALLPINFANQVNVQFGGSAALWGSGAIGGVVHLNNTSEFNKGLSIAAATSAGSFGDKQQNAECVISKKRFISSSKLFYHETKNNFPFKNTAQFGNPEQKMLNAELFQYGFLQENYFQLNSFQKITGRLWYQNNNRHIPGSMTTASGRAQQKDEFYRTMLEWTFIKQKISLVARTAFFDEIINFTDPAISLQAISHAKSSVSEAMCKLNISSKQSFNIGINNSFYQAVSENRGNKNNPTNYAKRPSQNRTALFVSYRINNFKNTWKANATIRQEFVSTGQKPLTGSVGFEGLLFKKFRLRGNSSKNYRLPDFNALYWTPGGNPNLLPELGFNNEVGLAFIHATNNLQVETEATTFSNKVDNWIMWLPNSYGIASAKNILSVWARGIEYNFKLNYKKNKVKFNFSAQYNYILSSNEKVNQGNENTLGKQLIYVPVEKIIFNLGAEYKAFQIVVTYNYNGFRYTTSDNSQYLNAYNLLNLDINKSFSIRKTKLNVFVQVNNITNTAYQVTAYYAMPGINFQTGIQLYFNKPITN